MENKDKGYINMSKRRVSKEYIVILYPGSTRIKGYIDLSKRRVSKEDIVFILYPGLTRIRDILIRVSGEYPRNIL